MTVYSSNPWIDFYRNIGYLTYAIVRTDPDMPVQKIKVIKRDLIKVWHGMDNNMEIVDPDAYSQIEFIFNWLFSYQLSARYAFDAFSDYVQKHPGLLTEGLKQQIIQHAEALAVKVHGHSPLTEQIVSDLATALEDNKV